MTLKPIATKPTLDEIKEFENELKIQLPQDYKQLLLENNGGRPQESLCSKFTNNDLYSFLDNSEQGSDIRMFYMIDSNSATQEVDKYKSFYAIKTNIRLQDNRILKGFIPIATDSGGNEFCLNVNPDSEEFGFVYFWDHEFEEEEPTKNNMTLIAKSFDEFIKSLTEDKNVQ